MLARDRLYLRPLGLIFGAAAAHAVDAGIARPLLGASDVAFPAVEIWRRRAGGIERWVVSVPEVPRWAEEARTAGQVARRLQTLSRPPAWPDGVRSDRPALMGVVNVTPDSFSDGGRFLEPQAAVAHGLQLWREGAAIVDVGGESTRPGARPLPVDEEIRRVVPVVRALADAGVFVSIDTRRAAVMQAAIAAGARMINDVSALSHDPEALGVAARSGLPLVLMHCLGEPATMQRNPEYERACLDVYDYLEGRLAACVAAGIARERLIADPGIGFGKTVEHNLDILHHLALYLGLGVPVLLGASRKSFIGRLSAGEQANARLPGSLAAALCGVVNGVSILRVHDIAQTQQAARVWRAIML